MRVLAVMPGLTPDAGAEQSLAALAPRFVAAGVNFHLALLTERQGLAPVVEAAGGVLHDLSASRGLVGRTRAIRRLIADISPTVVHPTLAEAVVPTQLAVVGTSTPVLVTWANTSYSKGRSAEGIPEWKLRIVQELHLVLGKVSRSNYHAVTSGVGVDNGRALHVPPDRIHVGERGRDPERYPERTGATVEAAAATRTGIGVPSDAVMLLAVGRQEPQKGYETLLDAFEDLARDRPDVHLVVAGRDGGSTARLQERLASMAARDRVHFLGQRSDVVDLLAAADVVVCSSWREGAAGALIEAMAMARPIVSVELEGQAGVLIDGHNAVVVPREALASGMARAVADPAMRERLGRAGREMFLERFTIERSAERMIEIYRTVGGE